MMKTIYTLHEYGSVSHFYGLEALAQQNNYKIKHREINQRNAIKRLLFEFNLHIITNIAFLISLPFRKRSKIVLAVAPYNKHVPLLMKILKRHDVYYFTSYTCWDQTLCVHGNKNNVKLIESWRYFTSKYVKHIFAVSNKTKDELIKNNFALTEQISVVNHSFQKDIKPGVQTKSLTFIQVGRLSPAKGISELLEIFKQKPSCRITFVGSGTLQGDVELAAKEYDNIHYLGYIKSFDKLTEIYKQHSFIIMNSQHLPDSAWEELFGMALIEGMACGCVPIATDHPGPKEIIENRLNGILYSSTELNNVISHLTKLSDEDYLEMRAQTIKKSQQYNRVNIAQKWSNILDKL